MATGEARMEHKEVGSRSTEHKQEATASTSKQHTLGSAWTSALCRRCVDFVERGSGWPSNCCSTMPQCPLNGW
uniref:Uncharacterized protein n=1 Tax=Arundo donax TaxID=35708 RepID=A0A0A9EQP2_ARUDO